MCSKFNHMQRDCTCACAVACLHPHNSISTVVVSLTIHDNLYIHIQIHIYIYHYMYKRCSKKHETIVEGQKASLTEHHGKCLTCKSFVILGFCLCLSVSLCLCVSVESYTDLTPLHSCTFASLFSVFSCALDHPSNSIALAQVVPQNRGRI